MLGALEMLLKEVVKQLTEVVALLRDVKKLLLEQRDKKKGAHDA
mgnify:CR=1 FL=1